MHAFIRDVFPICRSITGDGVRQTLARMQREIPISISEIPSGTKVFDWTVPKEWNIRAAYLDGPDGQRIADFSENNLHVVSYSIPVDESVRLEQLQGHLHSLPEHPEWIPYRTSYYKESWGFCLPFSQHQSLRNGQYRAYIDSDMKDGFLTLGETVIPGRSDEEVLIYSHLCHPSLVNDNLSGLAVTVWWAKHLLDSDDLRYTYRFVWGPGTIGSITWLAQNESQLENIKHGLVAVLLGRPGPFCYKRSRRGNAEIDRIAAMVLQQRESGGEIRKFDPYGYDERQFCSPGIDLSLGRLSRAPNGEYPEYHSSADNLDLINGESLQESLKVCTEIGWALEQNCIYQNSLPKCEPQLGKRGLYGDTGGENPKQREYAMLWVLNLSDGSNSLLDITVRSGLPYEVIVRAAKELQKSELIDNSASMSA